MDSELKQRVEFAEVEDAFIAAKKNRAKDPDGYAAAKAKFHKLRTGEREAREAAGVAPIASTIVTKSGVN